MSGISPKYRAVEPAGSCSAKSVLSPRKQGLLASSGIYLVSNVLNAAIPFALLPIMTRHLEPAEYGQIAMFQTVVAALGAFVGLNVQGAANRKVYDDGVGREAIAEFLGSCVLILAVSAATAVVLMLLLRRSLAIWLGIPASWLIAAVLVAAGSFLLQLRLGQWQVRGQAVVYGALQCGQALANALLSLLFVVQLRHGAEGRIEGQALTVTLFAGIGVLLLRRDRLVSLVWNPAHIREALRFGVPLIPHIGGAFLLGAVDRIVINDRLGLAAAGVYMVAAQLSIGLNLLMDAFNKAYVPWLFERLRRDDAAEKRVIVRGTYVFFAALLGVAAVSFLVGPPLVEIIAGHSYRDAGPLFGWLVLAGAFGGMYLLVTNYVFYSKRTGGLALVTLCAGVTHVGLVWWFTGIWGTLGAAIALATSMLLRFLFTWLVASRRHQMPWLLGAET